MASWHGFRVLKTGWVGRGGFFSVETPPSALYRHIPAHQCMGQHGTGMPSHRHRQPGPGVMPCTAVQSPSSELTVSPAGSCWFYPRKKDQSPLTMAGSSTHPFQTHGLVHPKAMGWYTPKHCGHTPLLFGFLCTGAALALLVNQQNQPTFRWLKVRLPFPACPPQSWSRNWSSRRRLSRRGPLRVSTPRSSFRMGR